MLRQVGWLQWTIHISGLAIAVYIFATYVSTKESHLVTPSPPPPHISVVLSKVHRDSSE
jgi:hypothetical protein